MYKCDIYQANKHGAQVMVSQPLDGPLVADVQKVPNSRGKETPFLWLLFVLHFNMVCSLYVSADCISCSAASIIGPLRLCSFGQISHLPSDCIHKGPDLDC